jgi:hypothetical protein
VRTYSYGILLTTCDVSRGWGCTWTFPRVQCPGLCTWQQMYKGVQQVLVLCNLSHSWWFPTYLAPAAIALTRLRCAYRPLARANWRKVSSSLGPKVRGGCKVVEGKAKPFGFVLLLVMLAVEAEPRLQGPRPKLLSLGELYRCMANQGWWCPSVTMQCSTSTTVTHSEVCQPRVLYVGG